MRVRPRSTSIPQDRWSELDLKAAGMPESEELTDYQLPKRDLWGRGYPWNAAKRQLQYAIWAMNKKRMERS